MCFDGGGEPGEGVARLATAGFDHRQQAFDEAASLCGLCAEGELSPNHRVTQGALGGVVGRLDACDVHEGPQVVLVFDKFLAEALGQSVEVTAQQHGVDPLPDRLHAFLEGGMGQRAIADFLP